MTTVWVLETRDGVPTGTMRGEHSTEEALAAIERLRYARDNDPQWIKYLRGGYDWIIDDPTERGVQW